MKTRIIVVIAAGVLAGVGATWADRDERDAISNGSSLQGSNMQGSNIQGSNVQGINLQGTHTTGTVPRQRATGLRLEAVRVVGGRLVPATR